MDLSLREMQDRQQTKEETELSENDEQTRQADENHEGVREGILLITSSAD